MRDISKNWNSESTTYTWKCTKTLKLLKKIAFFLGFLLTSNLFEKRWTPISKFDDSTYVDTYTLFDRFEIRYEIFQKFEIRNLHIRENAQKLKNTQISKKNSYIRTTTTHWTGRLRFQVSILFNTSKEKKEKLISNLKMMQTEDTMEMDTDCKQGEDEQVRVRSFFFFFFHFFFLHMSYKSTTHIKKFIMCYSVDIHIHSDNKRISNVFSNSPFSKSGNNKKTHVRAGGCWSHSDRGNTKTRN